MAHHNPTDAVSRRNVLKTAGGLLAGSTILAGLGVNRGAAAEEGLRFEVQEMTEETIRTRVVLPDTDSTFDRASPMLLGLADQFVHHDDEATVSLPEDTDGPARPVEMRRLDEQTAIVYFRTGDVEWPKEYEDEEITLGLGLFPERTVPRHYWDSARFLGNILGA